MNYLSSKINVLITIRNFRTITGLLCEDQNYLFVPLAEKIVALPVNSSFGLKHGNRIKFFSVRFISVLVCILLQSKQQKVGKREKQQIYI